MRRSIRSTRTTSASSRSPGGSRPRASGPRPEYQFESTPLMVRGVVYSTAGTRRAVVALDAATGELLWMHSEHEGARGDAGAAPALGPRPGVLDRRPRGADSSTSRPAIGCIALDAKTGNPIPSFGKGGVVDLKLERRSDDGSRSPARSVCTAAPIVAGNTVIIGAAHLSRQRAAQARATRRDTSAGSTSRPASGCGSSTRFHSPASSATTRG